MSSIKWTYFDLYDVFFPTGKLQITILAKTVCHTAITL